MKFKITNILMGLQQPLLELEDDEEEEKEEEG